MKYDKPMRERAEAKKLFLYTLEFDGLPADHPLGHAVFKGTSEDDLARCILWLGTFYSNKTVGNYKNLVEAINRLKKKAVKE